MAKVALVTNDDWGHYIHRRPLARALHREGHEVVFISPSGAYTHHLREEGFRQIDWRLDRRSLNPLKELLALRRLTSIYRHERFEVIQHFTIKPIIYGSIAALLSGRPKVINTFTGVSFPFLENGLSARFRPFLRPLIKWLLAGRDTITIFHNPDDRDLLLRQEVVPEPRAKVILGGGVDPNRFTPAPEIRRDPLIAIMVSRLLTDKGIAEYAEAGRLLAQGGAGVELWHVGGEDTGSLVSISPQDQRRYSQWVRFFGHRDDIATLLRQADIAVLPSHHEGLPRFLLEAAATGLPLVATNVGGCRFIVRDGENGYLIPVDASQQLADAILKLAGDPPLRQRMGATSRRMAVDEFDEARITEQYVEVLRSLIGSG